MDLPFCIMHDLTSLQNCLIHDGIYKIHYKGRDVFILDYSDCTEPKMISRLQNLQGYIETENKPVLLLSVFNEKNFVSLSFMQEAKKATGSVLHLLDKQAIVGLTDIKKMLLKTYNFMFNRNIQNFDSIDAALDYLTDDTISDKGYKYGK